MTTATLHVCTPITLPAAEGWGVHPVPGCEKKSKARVSSTQSRTTAVPAPMSRASDSSTDSVSLAERKRVSLCAHARTVRRTLRISAT
jgi:hypothetical protein